MKRLLGLRVASVISALFTLAACGEQRPYDHWHGDRTTENPPPKPPNCPALPEIASITGSDGTIVDVRIIQIDDVLFYVPIGWMQ